MTPRSHGPPTRSLRAISARRRRASPTWTSAPSGRPSAWRQRRFTDAYADLSDPAAYRRLSAAQPGLVRGSAWEIAADVLALGGPSGDLVRAAEQELAGGGAEPALDRAASAFDAIVAGMPEDQTRERWAIGVYGATAGLRAALVSGEWFRPTLNRPHWLQYNGSWSSRPDEASPPSDDTIWARPIDGRMRCRLAVPVGQRAEMEVRINVASLGDAEHARFGFNFDLTDENYSDGWHSVMIRPNQGVVTISNYDGSAASADLPPLGEQATLRVAIWDGFAAVWVDDRLVYKDQVPGRVWQGLGEEMALAGWVPGDTTAQCSNVRLRRLRTPPDEFNGLIRGLPDPPATKPRF